MLPREHDSLVSLLRQRFSCLQFLEIDNSYRVNAIVPRSWIASSKMFPRVPSRSAFAGLSSDRIGDLFTRDYRGIRHCRLSLAFTRSIRLCTSRVHHAADPRIRESRTKGRNKTMRTSASILLPSTRMR